MVFALSKWPYFQRVYLVTVCELSLMTVYQVKSSWNVLLFGNFEKCESTEILLRPELTSSSFKVETDVILNKTL